MKKTFIPKVQLFPTGLTNSGSYDISCNIPSCIRNANIVFILNYLTHGTSSHELSQDTLAALSEIKTSSDQITIQNLNQLLDQKLIDENFFKWIICGYLSPQIKSIGFSKFDNSLLNFCNYLRSQVFSDPFDQKNSDSLGDYFHELSKKFPHVIQSINSTSGLTSNQFILIPHINSQLTYDPASVLVPSIDDLTYIHVPKIGSKTYSQIRSLEFSYTDLVSLFTSDEETSKLCYLGKNPILFYLLLGRFLNPLNEILNTSFYQSELMIILFRSCLRFGLQFDHIIYILNCLYSQCLIEGIEYSKLEPKEVFYSCLLILHNIGLVIDLCEYILVIPQIFISTNAATAKQEISDGEIYAMIPYFVNLENLLEKFPNYETFHLFLQPKNPEAPVVINQMLENEVEANILTDSVYQVIDSIFGNVIMEKILLKGTGFSDIGINNWADGKSAVQQIQTDGTGKLIGIDKLIYQFSNDYPNQVPNMEKIANKSCTVSHGVNCLNTGDPKSNKYEVISLISVELTEESSAAIEISKALKCDYYKPYFHDGFEITPSIIEKFNDQFYLSGKFRTLIIASPRLHSMNLCIINISCIEKDSIKFINEISILECTAIITSNLNGSMDHDRVKAFKQLRYPNPHDEINQSFINIIELSKHLSGFHSEFLDNTNFINGDSQVVLLSKGNDFSMLCSMCPIPLVTQSDYELSSLLIICGFMNVSDRNGLSDLCKMISAGYRHEKANHLGMQYNESDITCPVINNAIELNICFANILAYTRNTYNICKLVITFIKIISEFSGTRKDPSYKLMHLNVLFENMNKNMGLFNCEVLNGKINKSLMSDVEYLTFFLLNSAKYLSLSSEEKKKLLMTIQGQIWS